MDKIVVVNNHTLGLLKPNSNEVEIIHASILKGAPANYNRNPSILVDHKDEVRVATREDFDAFNVSSRGFIGTGQYIHG